MALWRDFDRPTRFNAKAQRRAWVEFRQYHILAAAVGALSKFNVMTGHWQNNDEKYIKLACINFSLSILVDCML